MPEQGTLLKITLVFLILAAGFIITTWVVDSKGTLNPFTFYKSELTINGTLITEKVYFSPGQSYHALYRNVNSKIYEKDSQVANRIKVINVTCSAETPYVNARDDFCTFINGMMDCDASSWDYEFAEENEYGCTRPEISYGDYVFFSGTQYWIEATYRIYPHPLYEKDGRYYVKFIAYSSSRHPELVLGSSLVVNGDVLMDDYFMARDEVPIYISVDPASFAANTAVLPLDSDYHPRSTPAFISYVLNPLNLMLFVPIILLCIIWHIFGREKTNPDIPEILTEYPKKRKGWEVALFFNPPLDAIDKNFYSSMLLELQQRKIIAMRTEKKKGWLGKDKLFIRLLKEYKTGDSIEDLFIAMLADIKKAGGTDSEGYFELNEAMKKKVKEKRGGIFSKKTGVKSLNEHLKGLKKEVENQGKEYYDTKGERMLYYFLMPTWLIPGLIIFVTQDIYPMTFIPHFVFLGALSLALTLVVNGKSTLRRFKGDLYEEYERWQAFKHFVGDFTQLKMHPPEGQVMWGEYLTYATALGVADKVLDKLKDTGIIYENQYNTYYVAVASGSSFGTSVSSTTGGSAGGGGGGAGGGGGGGR